jgi:hypothetical protein
VTVDLSFDFLVEIHFLVTGRFPIALMNEIAELKNEIYAKLRPDVARPNMLTGYQEFSVLGEKFQVLFASDQKQINLLTDTRSLRVIHIHKL